MRRKANGFTLIEVIIALTLLVIVLVTSYQIFSNCLITERTVEELTIPEKVGEGILTLMRRDIAGAFFKGSTEALAGQVFMGVDAEGVEGGEDRVFFLSSVDPKAREDLGDWESLRTVCVVGYFLQENQATDDHMSFTLYRKEITEFDQNGVLDAPGMNYVVYDKVKSLDIWYFDGYEWLPEWSSEAWIADQEALAAERAELEEAGLGGVPRVSQGTTRDRGADKNVNGGRAGPAGDPQIEGDLFTDPLEEATAPIPVAVRIDLEIYAAIGRRVRTKNDEPILKRYSTIVPILTARRPEIDIAGRNAARAGGAGGAGAGGLPEGTSTASTFGSAVPDGAGGKRGRSGDGGGRGGPPGGFGGRDLRRALRGEGGGRGGGPPGLGQRVLDRLRSSGGSGGGFGGRTTTSGGKAGR